MRSGLRSGRVVEAVSHQSRPGLDNDPKENQMRFKKLLVGVGATVAVAGMGVGAAYGVWSTTGSGSGDAAATVAKGLTVTSVSLGPTASLLYPGAPPQSVYFNVANPNPYAVTITSVAWGAPTSANPAACPNSMVSVDSGAPTSVSISIPANSPSNVFSIGAVLDMSHSAFDGCQGVEFNVPMTITGVQQ
jgi:hypothetical protein